jgi:hypothetical protein
MNEADSCSYLKYMTILSRICQYTYLNWYSLSGVFAVGDVRGGSIKRVASAVGEGSIAVSFVHNVLQE